MDTDKNAAPRDGLGLPELPRPTCTYADHSYPAYTASQMRAYAQQCIAHARPEAVDQKRALSVLVGAAGLMLAEIDTCGHDVDPAYRNTLHDAWTQGQAALAPERAP